jgi:hypothetical protein
VTSGAQEPIVAPPSDQQWQQQIHTHLAQWIPQVVPGFPVVVDVISWAEDVWVVHLACGGRIVAKHQVYGIYTRNEPFDLMPIPRSSCWNSQGLTRSAICSRGHRDRRHALRIECSTGWLTSRLS